MVKPPLTHKVLEKEIGLTGYLSGVFSFKDFEWLGSPTQVVATQC
jgi:hypothetical protein